MRNCAFLIGACSVALCVLLSSPLAGLCATKPVDLSPVPQISDTPQLRDERMRWFRDAKLGMMICWGPSSLGECEIGWSRKAARPWDIGKPNNARQRTEDPVYDNYYKESNMHWATTIWIRI